MTYATSRPAIKCRILPRFPVYGTATAPIARALTGNSDVVSWYPQALSAKTTPASTDKVVIRDTSGVFFETTVGAIPSVNPVIVNKTANYTLIASDLGKNFSLGGTAYFTLTIPQPATLTSGFTSFTVTNADTIIPKIVTYTNADATTGTFRLYGKQAATFYTDASGNWYALRPERYKALTTITFYVSPSGSNTTNHGMTSGSPLATMTEAYKRIVQEIDCNKQYPYIQLAAGTYTESLDITTPPVGTNLVYVVGDNVTPGNVVWKPGAGNVCCQARDNGVVIIQGVKFYSTTNGQIALYAAQFGVIDLGQKYEFSGFPAGTHIYVAHGGSINDGDGGTKTISGSAAVHIYCSGAGAQYESSSAFITFTGVPTFTYYISCAHLGHVNHSAAATFAGTFTGQIYQANPPCSVSIGANVIPGSVAGVTAAVAWVD